MVDFEEKLRREEVAIVPSAGWVVQDSLLALQVGVISFVEVV